MAIFKELIKSRESVALDGNEFIDCTFQACELVYGGGELPKLQRCHFAQCSWKFEDAAIRTIQFLRSIYHSGPGGQALMEGYLKYIRTSDNEISNEEPPKKTESRGMGPRRAK